MLLVSAGFSLVTCWEETKRMHNEAGLGEAVAVDTDTILWAMLAAAMILRAIPEVSCWESSQYFVLCIKSSGCPQAMLFRCIFYQVVVISPMTEEVEAGTTLPVTLRQKINNCTDVDVNVKRREDVQEENRNALALITGCTFALDSYFLHNN